MTTPRWTRNIYVRSILAALLVIFILVTLVCLVHNDVFSSSPSTPTDKVRQELSKTNSLKTLVASWLKGEFHLELFIYENFM